MPAFDRLSFDKISVQVRTFYRNDGMVPTVHLALLLPMSVSRDWPGGRQIAGAATLAVDRVNADKNLLPGHLLQYSSADSGCSVTQGLEAMGKLLAGKDRIDAVIGPEEGDAIRSVPICMLLSCQTFTCSSACEITSHLAVGENVPQISYACMFHLTFHVCFQGFNLSNGMIHAKIATYFP